jgi:arginyl-tRNA--protein-N-Asp/Glu arginylyltransferase
MAIAPYRIYFINRYGRIETVDEFAAINDDQAVYVAALIHAAVADLFHTYEVWQGWRRVNNQPARQPLELCQAQLAQEIAIEREEMLKKSRTLIARSRLLTDTVSAAQAPRKKVASASPRTP